VNVTVLTDQKNSWFVEYGYTLINSLNDMDNVNANYIFNQEDIPEGNDILFMLSCVKRVTESTLGKSDINIVIHASDLPEGKGFSPLQWQIREGKSEIVLSLFKAVADVDAGEVFYKVKLSLLGNELLNEMREKMALTIIKMCERFVSDFPNVSATPQLGDETFYRRLNEGDDELDINKSINEIMDQLRASDFENYPPYFYYKGRKFYMRIEADE